MVLYFGTDDNGLEAPFPGISEHIMWTNYTSPRDVQNLFGEDGNVIGTAQKSGQVGENPPPIKDPEIKNLYCITSAPTRECTASEESWLQTVP